MTKSWVTNVSSKAHTQLQVVKLHEADPIQHLTSSSWIMIQMNTMRKRGVPLQRIEEGQT